jgi:hypothetical protein
VVDARNEKIGPKDALKLVAEASRLIVAKGKKLVEFDLKKKDRPGDDVILKHIMGPTGNLRAPAVKRGRTLVVGFHADGYPEIFGS